MTTKIRAHCYKCENELNVVFTARVDDPNNQTYCIDVEPCPCTDKPENKPEKEFITELQKRNTELVEMNRKLVKDLKDIKSDIERIDKEIERIDYNQD